MTGTRRTAVLYDSACNICKTITETLMTWDRSGVLEPVAIQSDEGQELLREVPVEKRLQSFHLAQPGVPVISGGPALAKLFRLLPGGIVVAKALEASPGTTSDSYEWIARNRVTLSRFIPGAVKKRANQRLESRLDASRSPE